MQERKKKCILVFACGISWNPDSSDSFLACYCIMIECSFIQFLFRQRRKEEGMWKFLSRCCTAAPWLFQCLSLYIAWSKKWVEAEGRDYLTVWKMVGRIPSFVSDSVDVPLTYVPADGGGSSAAGDGGPGRLR